MLDNRLTPERVSILLDRLYNLDFKPKLMLAIDNTLKIGLGSEEITLDPALQTRAFELTSEAVSDRLAVEFAEDILKQVRVLAEEDARRTGNRNEGNRVPRSGGENKNSGGNNNNTGRNHPDPRKQPSGQPSGNKHPPPTVQEVFSDITDFIAKNRSPFRFETKVLESMARKVVEKRREIQESLGLSDEQITGLAAVSLYDIYFLCDDSGSMVIGNRIPALMKTLCSVADWATILEPQGISLRFLNYDGDQSFDNLADAKTIMDVCHLVKPGGGTELGAVLQNKIVNLRSLQAKRVGLRKPLIVAIITDGEPTDDDPDCFQKTIINCKKDPNLAALGEGSIIFILFQVGNSSEARNFIEGVADHEDVRDILYFSRQPLDELDAAMSRALIQQGKQGTRDTNMYKRRILDEFISAIREEKEDEDVEPNA